ncbi:queuine tRNA-ribosyltransferase catalytic subunit [Diabrotica virgifera virgifera]|uniref:Queuine tRNA-ribosyltransferase catalytic subunit 1 n=1 Tax=Diabrotica virgifera virgifera TaxID=50390 RepID=A0A6P7F4J6_DIAVI|nr:queuine tRNA-ribosyltransferase catalytic subunit [Diabrotica virgifera virgifera]
MSLIKKPLTFDVISSCKTSKARVGKMILPHGPVDTPVFMPVGTQGTLKGMLPEQLEKMGLQIMLANTYHLGTKPGPEILRKAGGLHKFMNWNRPLLTDSGGFQMVSLLKLAEITEDGVKFQSLNKEKGEVMLTPEHSIEIQNAIGADIIMQLDDVIKTTSPDKSRIEESVYRTTRWLDRCLNAHQNPEIQNIFPIVQGTLYEDLRVISAQDLIKRDTNGFAIGGLSGGESKDDFWKIVHLCTDLLPKNKPRYLMGVGFAVDLVVCSALGVDMFDCVFPTRTARFGCALIMTGQLNLRKQQYVKDFSPIDKECWCSTCKNYTRAYLHKVVTDLPVACTLLTEHNVAFQMRLMEKIRSSVSENRFPEFVQKFILDIYPNKDYPSWVKDSLKAVNIELL